MSREYRKYRFLYFVASITIRLLYGVRPYGRENIPEGAALFCANHSNWSDPFLMAFALGKENFLHFMAKVELFKNKLMAPLFRAAGAFPVDRSKADLQAVRTTMKFLRSGEKIGIFPEGTRADTDNAVEAKMGAIKFAEKTGAPIVPVYIPRKKRVFSRVPVVIGQPYYVNPEKKKLTPEDYEREARLMMDRIHALRGEDQ